MKHSVARIVSLAVVVLVSLAISAWADTLEMKDGRVIQGTYLGGTRYHIRFLVDNKVELYPVEEVLTMSFGTAGAAPAASKTAATQSGTAASHEPQAKTPATQAAPSFKSSVTVPAGTPLLVRMIDGVDSATNKVGDRFRASLEQDLVLNDMVIAPKGTDVYGRLAEAKGAGHIEGKSQLTLELTGITINGQVQTIVSSDYNVAGKSRGKQSAERIGGGAALGAVIGAIAGGGKGAAVGAAVGAGAGTAVQVITKGEQVRVPSETLLEFRLQQPLTILPR